MKALVYTSSIADHIENVSDLVDAIIAKSSVNNPKLDLTGALVLENRRFLQILEGPEENVALMFDRISQDDRHGAVDVLFDVDIQTRSFPEWSMRAFSVNEPGTFTQETLESISAIFAKNFVFEGPLFINMVRSLLNDEGFLKQLVS